MNQPDGPKPAQTWEPTRPTLLAAGFLSLWIVILSLPMLMGKFLGNPHNDQVIAGYAFRLWGATQWKTTGHVPLWNPELFGGLPFVAAMHGDIFYPTAWLRLIFPTATVMNLEFPVHYILAGLLVYALLRMLKTSWAGAVTAGLAYEMSGVIISYVAPGHDGKLFVTALLPLALIGLVLGIRDRRYEGYGVLALAVGLAMISPQAQMTYYMLIVAGLFALYLTFGSGTAMPRKDQWMALGLALAAVIVGFGIGAIQMLPFYHYLPFSPRAEQIGGFETATSYAIPWSHVPELFMSGFAGRFENGTYWGPNGLKLHSEYLGLPVVALAIAGFRSADRRRLIWWVSGIGLLFLLIAMGSATPFYRVWWAVMPFVKKTRAPGMALYVVALMLGMLAGFGVERLQRGEGRKAVLTWLVVGVLVALAGATGLLGAVADSLAQGIATSGYNPGAVQSARAAQPGIMIGAVGSGVALILVAGLVWLLARGRVSATIFAVALPILIGADLWRAGRDFWMYEDAPQQATYAPDSVTNFLRQQSLPYRVLDFGGYGGSELMAFDVPQVLGYHSNELRFFDEIAGRQTGFRNAGNRQFWDLFAVRYLIIPTESADSVPGYHKQLSGVTTAAGPRVNLFEADSATAPPYARLVPAAIKAPDEQAINALFDPRFSHDGLVILDTAAAVTPERVSTIPAPLAVQATVTQWSPGQMAIQLKPAAPQASYLLVSENWYKDWTAQVDGKPAPVYRGDVSLITVPVPQGAQQVSLAFVSPDFAKGKLVTLFCTALAFLGLIVPPMLRKRGAAGA